jgi:hypothetical protein
VLVKRIRTHMVGPCDDEAKDVREVTL